MFDTTESSLTAALRVLFWLINTFNWYIMRNNWYANKQKKHFLFDLMMFKQPADNSQSMVIVYQVNMSYSTAKSLAPPCVHQVIQICKIVSTYKVSFVHIS